MIYHTHELSEVLRVCAAVGVHHRALFVTDVLQLKENFTSDHRSF